MIYSNCKMLKSLKSCFINKPRNVLSCLKLKVQPTVLDLIKHELRVYWKYSFNTPLYVDLFILAVLFRVLVISAKRMWTWNWTQNLTDIQTANFLCIFLMSVYKPFTFKGPWRSLNFVTHRRRDSHMKRSRDACCLA